MARQVSMHEKLEDFDEDFTTAHLPVLPCRACGQQPIAWPHSICAVCVEKKRETR